MKATKSEKKVHHGILHESPIIDPSLILISNIKHGLFTIITFHFCPSQPRVSDHADHAPPIPSTRTDLPHLPCRCTHHVAAGAMLLRPALRTPPQSDSPLLFPRVVFRPGGLAWPTSAGTGTGGLKWGAGRLLDVRG